MLDDDEIVPRIVAKAPSQVLSVTYEEEEAIVELGNVLRPAQTTRQPLVSWRVAREDAYHALAMIDADAPIRVAPFLADFNHWLVGNVRGCDLNDGRVLAEYRGCAPPRGTGLHRYVFLLYEQPGRLEFEERAIGASDTIARLRFDVKRFASKYGLGEPIAGNYFKSQWCPSTG